MLFSCTPKYILFLSVFIVFSTSTDYDYDYIYGGIDEIVPKKPSIPTVCVRKFHPAFIPLPFQDTYRRVRTNKRNIQFEHIYRVCTTNVTTDCGFWQNVKNNKTVQSGRTFYDKRLGELAVEDFRRYDSGRYMTGDRKHSADVYMKLIIF